MKDFQWRKIAAKYAEEIANGGLRPGDKLPSDAEVAELWKVSRPTAHRALAELQRQGLLIRQRRWGTVVAPSERKSTGKVALLFDQVVPMFNFPARELIDAIHEALGGDYRVEWIDCRRDPERESAAIDEAISSVDGVIAYPTAHPSTVEAYQRYLDSGQPLVFLDRAPYGLVSHVVTHDHAGGMREAVRILAEAGHRRVAYIGFHKPHVNSAQIPLLAYREAVKQHGLEESSRLERHLSADLEVEDGDRFLPAVHDAIAGLRGQRLAPTAIICGQDMLSVGVVEACDNLNLAIPEDLEVATYNYWPGMLLRRSNRLLRIVPRMREIGLRAADLLLQQIRGEQPEPRQWLLPTEILLPGSGIGSLDPSLMQSTEVAP